MAVPVRTVGLAALIGACALLLAAWPVAAGDPIAPPDAAWVTVTEAAEGTNLAAKDRAIAAALRKAVRQVCGSFIHSQEKVRNYKLVYSKILEDTAGYVVDHKVGRTWVKDGLTNVQVQALVSKQRFEKRWSYIAHTLDQENNPRCIVAIGEDVLAWPQGKISEVTEAGVVQSKLEDFFLSKGLKLMDRNTTKKVSKRDILLASLKGDTTEIAALGARFGADVFLLGNCSAQYGRAILVAGQTLHQFTATLKIRAIRADSSELLVSKTFGPLSYNSFQRPGGEDKAMAKLAEDSAPKILKAVVEAWRKQVNVRRTIQLQVVGMKYKQWKAFRDEAVALRGIQALRLREITEGVALIDVEYSFAIQNLADQLGELKKTKLEVDEISANRIKLKAAAE